MFRFFSTQDASSSTKKRFVKGALLLVGALFALWLIVWLLPGSAPPPVHSDEAGTVATQPEESDPAVRLITPGRALVMLLLAGGLGYALYLRQQSNDTTPGSAPMQSIGHLPISQDQQLKLVSCQDEVLLLGISPNEITLLRTYPHAAFEEASAAPSAGVEALPDGPPVQPDASLSGFANLLRQYTNHGRHA